MHEMQHNEIRYEINQSYQKDLLKREHFTLRRNAAKQIGFVTIVQLMFLTGQLHNALKADYNYSCL